MSFSSLDYLPTAFDADCRRFHNAVQPAVADTAVVYLLFRRRPSPDSPATSCRLCLLRRRLPRRGAARSARHAMRRCVAERCCLHVIDAMLLPLLLLAIPRLPRFAAVALLSHNCLLYISIRLACCLRFRHYTAFPFSSRFYMLTRFLLIIDASLIFTPPSRLITIAAPLRLIFSRFD